MYPALNTAPPPGHGLKAATVAIGVFSWLAWCVSTGFLTAWGYGYFSETPKEAKIFYGNFLSIPANVGMIYATSRIIFITECDFQKAGTLEDLSRCVSRLVTFSLLSFTAWVNSIVWLSLDNTTNFRMYHGCNYGFILGGVVALMAGSLAQKVRKAQLQALKNNVPQTQTHQNLSFAPPYSEYP